LGIAVLSIKMIKDHNWKHYFLLFWIISALLGSFSRQRMAFFIAAPAALVGGYFLSYALNYVSKLDIIKKREVKEGVNIFSTFIILLISLLLIVNFSTGFAFAKGIGPSFNSNWQNAMNYLKTNTSEDAAILSWWDYGYWFQTGGERASIADGGNQNSTVDEIIAKRMISSNVSYFIPLLEQYKVDYVIVDYTLIGKNRK
jgi:asparagine N-glycosylation enzyme membrane subunit Stt3